MRSRNADFACAVVIVGLLAGCAGLATSLLLRSIEHLTYHYTFGSLLQAVTASSLARRRAGPDDRRRLAGLGWWFLRSRADVPQLSSAIEQPSTYSVAALRLRRLLQVLVVGSGASLGREDAPRQLAAALGDFAHGLAQAAVAARPGNSAGLRGRRRPGRGLRGAARRGAVHAANHVEELASSRGRRRVDHLEPGRVDRLRSSPHNQPNLYWPNPQTVLSADRDTRSALGPLSAGVGSGVQSPDGRARTSAR